MASSSLNVCSFSGATGKLEARRHGGKFSRSFARAKALSHSVSAPNSGEFRGAARSARRVFHVRAVSEEEPAEAATEAAVEEKEDSSRAEGAPSEPAATQSFLKDLVLQLKDAIGNSDEVGVEEVQAKLEAIDKDREYLAQQVSSLTEEISAGKERFLRLNADFENFRRRSEREKSDLATSVKGDVVEQLLPMIDNFERAKTSIKTETDAEKKIENSYQSIYKQFVEAMKSLGVSAVDTVGRAFDPNVHDAIMREDSAEYGEGVVIEEFRKGFVIGSKLLRPAMVKVSSGPGPAQESAKAVAETEQPETQEATAEEGQTVEQKEE